MVVKYNLISDAESVIKGMQEVIAALNTDGFNDAVRISHFTYILAEELSRNVFRYAQQVGGSNTLPPIDSVKATEVPRDGGKFIDGKYVPRRELLNTEEVIAECKTMPYARASEYVYRMTIGTQKYRIYRQDMETWRVDVTDSTRNVRNDDEKEYRNPSYLRGFLERHVSIGMLGNTTVDTLLWQRQSWRETVYN